MKVTVEKKESNKVHLNVELENDSILKEYNRAFSQHSRHVKIKGFRKGKVPQKMLEKYLDTEAIKKEVVQEAISKSYQEAVQSEQLESIAEPQIEAVQTELDQPIQYKAVVEVRPDVALGNYKDLTVKVPALETVDDEKIDEQLEQLRRKHATLLPVEDRGAQMGDNAIIKMEGKVDGETITIGESEEMNLELQEGNFVAGFSEGVVGMKIDEEKEIAINFPEDYMMVDLQGKEVVFHVTVVDLKEVELPEIDDEFAKTVGEFETMDALKERINTDLGELLEEQYEISRQQGVLDKVISGANVDVPDSMVERELVAMWQMGEGQHLQAQQAKEDVMRASLHNFVRREDHKEAAVKRIKTTLVLGSIAREENLMVSQEEVSNEIAQLAASYNVAAEQVHQQLEKEGRMLALIDEMLSFKIIEWLMTNNTVEDGEEEASALDVAQAAADLVENTIEAMAEASEEESEESEEASAEEEESGESEEASAEESEEKEEQPAS